MLLLWHSVHWPWHNPQSCCSGGVRVCHCHNNVIQWWQNNGVEILGFCVTPWEVRGVLLKLQLSTLILIVLYWPIVPTLYQVLFKVSVYIILMIKCMISIVIVMDFYKIFLWPLQKVLYLTMELFQPQMRKITSGYHDYPLKGLNFWYMYCSQKTFAE